MVVTDVPENDSGSATPAENEDDFFTSWDKPTIKRPSNPPSRTATPSGSRTGSPFLNAPANGNGPARPKSPLAGTEGAAGTAAAAPAASRAIPASAIKKTTASAGPRKANILGAKKTKLGAKKVAASEGLDFDAAEKKAKEEAERIEKLGYNPDEEEAQDKGKGAAAGDSSGASILSPTPISPPPGGYGSAVKGRERSSSEMERLGMGIGRLGFGQVGSKPGAAAAAAAPKKLGFGATSKPAAEGESISSFFPILGLCLLCFFLNLSQNPTSCIHTYIMNS